ncbi:unnamed protein product [Phytophthora lilii]|uniref:Unnamed protein product n=1 Tax=Phytophthora lilii TaxID=2077276 RepID=A0A9W6UBQ7_9STRA|nr:unnamed protein product [Phytophthora lilii]
MLRRWPARGLSATRPPQRAFWSQVVELVTRLQSGDAARESADASGTRDGQPRTSNRERHAQHPARAELPALADNWHPSQIRQAKRVFSDFALHLRRASEPAQLLQSWELVKQCRPFVVDHDGIRLADDEAAAASDKPKGLYKLQMLRADVFAQRTAGTNRRSIFVGTEASGDYITVANEAVVVALLVEYLGALGAHKQTIRIFEGYNRKRVKWLNERCIVHDEPASTGASSHSGEVDEQKSTSGANRLSAVQQKKIDAFTRATRLWAPARSAYLKALLTKSQYHKATEFARGDSRNLDVACKTVEAMSGVLIGCRKEKDSALARLAIATMSKKNPVAVLPPTLYELAFKAAIQKKSRDERDLDNALWLVRAMQDDAGYVLHPGLWFSLFNTTLHLKREDCAVEVFRMYSNNFTSLHQDYFRRALRKACRLNHPDVVLTIVRQWLDAVADSMDAAPKSEVLNFVLWEMLSSDNPVSAISEVFSIMTSSQIKVGGMTLQRATRRILDDASENHLPHEAIKISLEFWETNDCAVQNSISPIYTLLHQCLERGWIHECELVVKEIIARRMPAVPCNTIVKVLGANEERNRFEDNVRICESLLNSLSRPGLNTLNQRFFEDYMKALVCLGRFDEVRKQHARFKLGKRFPKSTHLAIALRDASTQQVHN